jgi:hypothetical protein
MLNLPRCGGVATLSFLLAVGCGGSPTAPPPPPVECTVSVSLTSIILPAAGGTVAVAVTTPATCAWTASTAAPWLTASPSSGIGPGPVTISAQVNTSTQPRTASAIVAGVTVTVQQEAVTPCVFVITPTSAAFGENGGTGTITVTTGPSCAWFAASTAAWMTILSGATGSGPGTTTFRVDANVSPQARAGELSVAGLPFTVQQTGDVNSCTYQVSPVSLSICMAWSTDLVSEVTTQNGCPWTASSTASWMPVTAGASGMGSGTVRIRGTDNYDAPRNGVVQVRWPTVTEGQNIAVAQAGCTYAVTQSTFTIPASGGTGRFDVLQQAEPNSCGGPLQNACVWSVVSDVSWITITSPTTRTGDEAVTFSVGANTTGTARTGTLTVRDNLVRIIQTQ